MFSQIDSLFVIVGRVECRYASDPLGSESSPRAVGAAPIKGDPNHGGVVISDEIDVLQVGGLEEGVDSSKVREFAARECGNGLVVDAGCSRKAEGKAAGDFGLGVGCRDCGFLERNSKDVFALGMLIGCGLHQVVYVSLLDHDVCE